ncbi:unnamed protein product [Chrysoparadoxa australica]
MSGNKQLQQGRLLAQHTAGKNALRDACLSYATGLQVLHRAVEGAQVAEMQVGEDDEALGAAYRDMEDLELAMYLNLAATNLAMSEWDAAINCCTQVLTGTQEGITRVAEATLEGEGVIDLSGGDDADGEAIVTAACKALYRRAVGRAGKQEYGEAKSDLARALRLRPNDKQIRGELCKVKATMEAQEAKEQLAKQTEEGRLRRLRKAEAASTAKVVQHAREEMGGEDEDGIEATSPAPAEGSARHIQEGRNRGASSSEWDGGELAAVAGERGGLWWGQTTTQIRVSVLVPKEVTAAHVTVKFKPQWLTISYAMPGKEPQVAVDGKLSGTIISHESLWMLEEAGEIELYLLKGGVGETEPWPCLLEGEKAALTEEGQARVAAIEEAMKQKEANEAAQAEALKNPAKKALFDKMTAQFPDVPIVMKP